MHHKEIGKEGRESFGMLLVPWKYFKEKYFLKVDILDQQLWQIQKSKWLRKQVYFGLEEI